MHHDGEGAAGEMARIVPARASIALALARSLPEVEVGSGLPPSVQTSRSIIHRKPLRGRLVAMWVETKPIG